MKTFFSVIYSNSNYIFLCIALLLFLIEQSNNKKLKKAYENLSFNKNEIIVQHNLILEKEKKIQCLEQYDKLTKLPNKHYLNNRLEKIFQEKNNEKYALFFIDIDNFKNINDTLGHDYGDELLYIVSQMLKNNLTKEYSIFRWGGDEFVIILEKCSDKIQLSAIAENIIGCLDKEFKIWEKQLYITVSIGIAIFPEDAQNSNDIIKSAEIAMYNAKQCVGNKYFFYTQELKDEIYRKNAIEKHLRKAILEEELTLVYQPQYSMGNRNIVGYEALLRWYNKELGQVAPSEFIPIAEESNIIICIGNWVLRNACKQNSEWIKKGYKNIVAVNISAIQFEQKNFVSMVKKILFETKLEPQFLELEITETVLIKSFEKSIETIEKLKDMGISISLDDFGTGYSSLSYLRKLPIDTLKIDKCFIDDICTSDSGRLILQGIVQLAHTINLKVIAEGVETIGQADMLEDFNCDIAQGFLYSKPVNKEDMEKMFSL